GRWVSDWSAGVCSSDLDALRDRRAILAEDRLHRPRAARASRHPRGVRPPRQAGACGARAGSEHAVLTEASGVNDIGKTLIVLGLLIALAGLVLVFVGRVPWIGRLPGDIHVQRGNWSFYFPLGTSILLSLLLTLLFWLFGRR